MSIVEIPGPTAALLSWHEGREFFLSLVFKCTYTVGPDGACSLAPTQDVLAAEPRLPGDFGLCDHDVDLLPNKPLTDVIVVGHAHAYEPSRQFTASVTIGRRTRRTRVHGPRRCALTATGKLVFSEPDPVERVSLSFESAYGGFDRVAEAETGNPWKALAPYLRASGLRAELQSPFVYPRNPCGRGYLIRPTRQAVEQCELPLLEDFDDPLTPDRLPVRAHERWIAMPMSSAFGVVAWGWWPRIAWSGIVPEFDAGADPVPEIARNLLPREALQPGSPSPERRARFTNGAPLDLQWPHLRGDEMIDVENMHPRRPRWPIRLPGQPVRMQLADHRRELRDARPVLHTVRIEPEADRVLLVWCGTIGVGRPYFPQELAALPIRVDIATRVP